MSEQAFAGLRVIDLSRVLAGPYCTMLLADHGADVIKIEQPHVGDETRNWGPPWVGDQSAYFLSANRNKRSMTLNLKSEQGRDILKKLAASADLLVENFKVGTLDRLGLGYETLSAANPRLIYCAITGYGQTGPYRDRPGYDFMIQAQGGIMSITGPPNGAPYKVGVAIADVTAGLFAVNAILTALYYRERSGRGQYIDIALLDSQIAWLVNVAHNYFATGNAPQRYGNAHPNIVPYETFPTADGQIALAVGSDQQYQRLCELMECPDLWADERFQTNAGRVNFRESLIPQLRAIFQQKTTAEWMDRLIAAQIPASPVNDIPTILADPQVQARGMVQELAGIKLLGSVAKFSETPAQIRRAPPALGQDTDLILQEYLGFSQEQIQSLREAGVI